MSDHTLDTQPENRIFTEIADLKRQLLELRTLQKQGNTALNLTTTAEYTATSSPITDGNAAVFRFTLTNSLSNDIFATFHHSIYQASVSLANCIGDVNSLGFSYKWAHRRDRQASDGHNIFEEIWVENHTGSSQTIVAVGYWRYIVNGGTAVVS